MPSPAPEASDPAFDGPPPAGGWTECPHCGEPWVADSPYCTNCGWVPKPAAPADTAMASPARAHMLAMVSLLLGGAALAAMAWGWLGPRVQAPLPQPAKVASAAHQPPAQATAQPHAQAADSMPPVASRAASADPLPSAPSAPAAHASSATATVAPPGATAVMPPQPTPEPASVSAERLAREWLAGESSVDGSDATPARLRPLYADRVDYRGHHGAGWALILADKSEFARRWPKRQYQLLAIEQASIDAQGVLSTRLQLRWRLENQGRWREGTATAVLRLQRIEGQWRIVAESGG